MDESVGNDERLLVGNGGYSACVGVIAAIIDENRLVLEVGEERFESIEILLSFRKQA